MDNPRAMGTTDEQAHLPAIESGEKDDHTIASPAPRYGKERLEGAAPDEPVFGLRRERDQVPPVSPTGRETLSRDEVAAVSVDRTYYVSDVASPYLSSRQASEDVRTTKRRHTIRTTILVVVGILLAIGALGWYVWQTIESNKRAEVASYETATIERGEFLDTIDTTTLVRPISEVAVTAEASGTISAVMTSDGEYVEEGQELFHLENRTVTDAYNKAREALDLAKATLETKAQALDRVNAAVAAAQAELNAKPTDAARQTALATAQALVPAAQSEYDAANATLENIQQTFDRAQEQQDRLIVYAPVSGTACEFAPEATVGTSIKGSTRLCTITDSSRYCLEIEIPRESASMVGEGEEVRLRFPSLEDLFITTDIANLEDDGSLCMATVIIDEPDERIVKGTAVEASVIMQSIPDALIVPLEAVRTAEDGSTSLDVLLDPSRGIRVSVPVNVTGRNKTHAAVEADNIQAGTSVVTVNPEQ